jgi:RNA-directed DNA polymerase
MSGQRQKNRPEQEVLAFPAESRSEAPKTVEEGTETPVAKRKAESLAGTERLMEEVCEWENCKQALQRVKANKGSPGVDGMTVDELPEYLKQHGLEIGEQLRDGTYPTAAGKAGGNPEAGRTGSAQVAAVAERVADKRMLKLIRAFLEAGVMEDGLVSSVDEGTPQGGPLSPLLSNLVLDELDRELERRGHHFVRYADDCNIYVGSERAGQRVMESITRFITHRLKLKVNQAKSAVARPGQRKFLGFSFTGEREPRRRIAPKAIARFKQRIREQTRRTRGISLRQMVKDIATYLRGWLGYFADCQTPSVLQGLETWLRRRLRSVVWKQWKRGRTRFRELRKRGVGKDLAAKTAGSPHGPWRLANSPALHIALSNAYFAELGLPPMVCADLA